jgi:hypothetical protein
MASSIATLQMQNAIENKQRTCKTCRLTQAVELFPVARTVEGVTYYRRACVKCYSIQKTEERRRHAVWFTELKKTLKCQECGNPDHRVLQFHHKDRDLKDSAVSIMVIRKIKKEKILAEIAKCICLCANCHTIVHYAERGAKL